MNIYGEKTMDAKKIKLVAFDLDGTLTQHKTKLSAEHRAVLDRLAERYKLVMAGAGQCRRIFNQMDEYPIDIIGNYGMQESKVIDGKFEVVRKETAKEILQRF